MKLFLGAIMVLFVSGEDITTIQGFLYERVQLPCDCAGRNQKMGFRWQNIHDERILFKNNGINNEKCSERFCLSAPEDSEKCDIVLTNITAEDSGRYTCSFHRRGYKRKIVDLTVSARYNICEKILSAKVFQCDVIGRYRDAEIQWRLDGNVLQNSTTDIITHDYSWDSSKGLHHILSEFITNRNLTATPSCHIEAKYKSLNVSKTCEPEKSPQKVPKNSWKHYLAVIPFVIVFGIFIYPYRHHCFRFSRRRRRQILYKNAQSQGDSTITLTGQSQEQLCAL